MTTLDEHLAEMMQDPEFAREWERLQPEHEVRLAILRAESDSASPRANSPSAAA